MWLTPLVFNTRRSRQSFRVSPSLTLNSLVERNQINGRILGHSAREEARNQGGHQAFSLGCAERLFEACRTVPRGSTGDAENRRRHRHRSCFLHRKSALDRDAPGFSEEAETGRHDLGVLAEKIV